MPLSSRDEVKRLNLAANHDNPKFYIEEKLKVDIQEGNEFMTVRLTSTDPNEALTLVKALTAEYMGVVVYAEERGRKTHLASLDKAYNDAAANLEEKKASWQKNIKLHELARMFNSDTLTLTQMQLQILDNLHDTKVARNQIRANLLQAESTLDAHVAQMEAIKKIKLSDTQIDTATKADPKAAALETHLDRVKEVIQHYLDNAQHPEQEPTYRAAVRLKAELEEKYAKRRAEVKADVLARFEDQLKEDHDLTGLHLRLQIQKTKALLGDPRQRS